jgi:predicted dinucleotide-binding enzyme
MKKRRFKKEYIIITKEDIAYLQKSIIEFADTAAVQGADIALLNLGTEKIQKILKKIRNNKNNFLYLNENKNMSLMKFNDEPTLVSPIKLKRYSVKKLFKNL